MINKLISLVLLIFFLTAGYSYSEDQFLFPKKKPSVFKKIERTIDSQNLQEARQKRIFYLLAIIFSDGILPTDGSVVDPGK